MTKIVFYESLLSFIVSVYLKVRIDYSFAAKYYVYFDTFFSNCV